jgi:glutamate synthase (NADPH) small chain
VINKVAMFGNYHSRLSFGEIRNMQQLFDEAAKCTHCAPPASCDDSCIGGTDVSAALWALNAFNDAGEAKRILLESNPQGDLHKLCGQKCKLGCTNGPNGPNIKDIVDFLIKNHFDDRKPAPANGRKVTIIGSGPLGLFSAKQLALAGFQVKVIEANSFPGGELTYGIPSFRLNKSSVTRRIAELESYNSKDDKRVDIQLNTVLGAQGDKAPKGKKMVNLEELKNSSDAVILATGANMPIVPKWAKDKNIEGLYSAKDFLAPFNFADETLKFKFDVPKLPKPTGEKLLVVGGGNTAIDVARTAIREGGYKEVEILYRRDKDSMPGKKEFEDVEKGITLRELVSPISIMGEKKVTGVWVDTQELGAPDASGRRSPKSTGNHEKIEGDTVVYALGTEPNKDLIKQLNLKVDEKGYIKVDEKTGLTSVDGVYAGGDIAPEDAEDNNKYISNANKATLKITEAIEVKTGVTRERDIQTRKESEALNNTLKALVVGSKNLAEMAEKLRKFMAHTQDKKAIEATKKLIEALEAFDKEFKNPKLQKVIVQLTEASSAYTAATKDYQPAKPAAKVDKVA